jgi:hypothetical protein
VDSQLRDRLTTLQEADDAATAPPAADTRSLAERLAQGSVATSIYPTQEPLAKL